MEQLGIEPSLLLAQVVNFLIIVFVLSKVLYKPIIDMIDKRKREIEEGLTLTQKMREEEEKMQAKKVKLLEETRKEGRVVIEEAKKQAKEVEKDLVAQAQKQAEEIVAKGKADVERLHESMQKDVRKEAIDLAIRMTKRLLASVLSAKDQHALIEKHVKELESVT